MEKKFWQSTGFWTALMLLIIGGWTSFNTETGEAVSTAVISIGAAIVALQRLFKDGAFDFGKWIKNGNTWASFGVLISMLLGSEFTQLVEPIQNLIGAIADKNFGAILASISTLAVIIYNLVSRRENRQEVARIVTLGMYTKKAA